MKTPAILAGGLVFGAGLAISGMTRPEVVLDFLLLRDLGLLFVMGGGVVVGLAAFAMVRKPWLTDRTEPYEAILDRRTLMGSVLFGLGWGISGVCPGAAFASLGTGNLPVGVAVTGMLVGAWLEDRLFARK